jgi:hypothetical protein
MDISKMSKAQLAEIVAQMQASQESGLIVKKNSKGGIFIRSNDFREFSVNKGKEYTAGINLGMNTAKALFGNKELLDQVSKLVMAIN